MEFVRGFVVTDVAEVHASFQRCMLQAERLLVESRALGGRGRPPRIGQDAARMLAELRMAYRDFNRGLQFAAEKAAQRATQGMREMLSRKMRPDAAHGRGLKDYVSAVPLNLGQMQTGAVGVGDVSRLNKAVNPFSPGYGTYWRAQEYGTGQNGVPSQVGRILYGSFEAPGGTSPTPPDPQFAGGGGPHPIFRPGYQPNNGADRVSGLGTIGHEIQAKHFIKFGADEAVVLWRREIAAVQDRALAELRGMRLGRS